MVITFLSHSVWGQDHREFLDWLNQHKADFVNCAPKIEEDQYRLCDNTLVDKNLLQSLFKKTADDLHRFITQEKIKLKVYCNGGSAPGIFAKHCVAPDSKSLGNLHGKYLPEENTILIQSDASRGDLIHEYIHYLQFRNSNPVYGKRYKAERVEIQKALVQKMDKAIEKSKLAKTQQEIEPLVNSVKEASAQLIQFSYWQDLIDERNIFLLFLNHGHEFGVSKEDLDLAQKNMGFICKREKLPGHECVTPQDKSRKYFDAIIGLLHEIRPTVDDKELMRFITNVPGIAASLTLEKKITALNDYIFKQTKMVPDSSYRSVNQLDNILPDSALKNLKAHCLGLSILYLLAAERADIEAYLVRAPGHVFIRVCEKSRCKNIETLKRGEVVEDKYFIDNLFVTKRAIENGIYLKSLDSVKELLASVYLGLGYISGMSRQNELAELFYKKAIDHSRGFADAYSNLAAIYAAQGRMSQAKVYSEIALKVNPDLTPAMINLGAYFQSTKDLKKATEYYDQAIKLNPLAVEAYRRRAIISRDLGKHKEAAADYEHILIVNPNFCDVLKDLIELSKDKKGNGIRKSKLAQLGTTGKCLYLPVTI